MELSEDSALLLAREFGTPLFVYSEQRVRRQVEVARGIPMAFGGCVRFALKALSTKAVIQVMHQAGLCFDCSSGYEVQRALAAGVPGSNISLVSQELPSDLAAVCATGAQILPTSLHQLKQYGQTQALPRSIGIRVNPGMGSGSSSKTNVGGPSSSFGIWHEDIPAALAICAEYGLTVSKLHTHIGSGSDPQIWMRAAELSLALVPLFPAVTTLSLGGGFKVARVPSDSSCDITAVGTFVAEKFTEFYRSTGRKLQLEIEPGTFLVANAGWILTRVVDITATPAFRFLKVDCGMTEIIRPTMYAAQHPISIFPCRSGTAEYVVVGHCCESGDLLTPAVGDCTLLGARTLSLTEIGDLCVVGGAGAYCSTMCAKNYNSYPEAAEVLLRPEPVLIRRRQTLAQMLQNEISLPNS